MTQVHFPKGLQIHQYLPHPALHAWVECYWNLEHRDTNKMLTARLYPDGGSSLNFHFSDNASCGAWFSQTQTLRQMQLPAETDVFGIRFYPGGAFALLGLAMEELSAQVYPASALGLPLDSFHSQLHDARPELRPDLVDKWLLNRLQQHGACSGIVQQLWPRLVQGDHPVDYYLKNMASGRRKLERRFRQQVGTSPHQLRILHRIKQARALIKTGQVSSLTDVAQHCGFYDQSHFIRQFQAITLLTPGQYQRRHQRQDCSP